MHRWVYGGKTRNKQKNLDDGTPELKVAWAWSTENTSEDQDRGLGVGRWW